ncbi:MAG TPA: type I-B CRISPR-associated protein Cas7/Csh2 [Candidatus Gastranaerophilales bacterium]|nr:type I-B CRISPR-associated protein Cas7/Csh2 [Candidatus Gastranaerophilales bacterium]
MSEIKNRSEIIFLYDVKDNNPNGDPLNENKPRIDEETKINYVTDVRLKRTIRDFMAKFHKQTSPNNVFMLSDRTEDNKVRSKEERMQDFDNSISKVLNDCIDIRLFGGTFAIKREDKKSKNAKANEENSEENAEAKSDDSNAITGAVQFRTGRSLHRVSDREDQLAVTMQHSSGKGAGTFGFDQKLNYSLIRFYGVINENTAAHNKLSEEDVQKLLQATWWGTKELNTRSKIGHTPRLLMKIDYKPGFYIGDLDSKIKMDNLEGLQDEQLRSIDDYKLNMSKLEQALAKHKDKIERIYYEFDEDMELSLNVECVQMIKLSEKPWFNVYSMV